MWSFYRLFITMLTIIGSVFSCMSQEQPDTIRCLSKVNEVLVVREGDVTKVIANALDGNNETMYYYYKVDVTENDSTDNCGFSDSGAMEVPFYKPDNRECDFDANKGEKTHKIRRAVVGFDHTYWGWRFNYNDKAHIKNCFELGFRELIGVSWQKGKRGPSFSTGVGFGMFRYLAQDGYCFGMAGDRLEMLPMQEGAIIDHSWLDMFTFHVPVLLELPLGKEGLLTIGGVLNFNSYARAMTQFKTGNNKYKIDYKGLQQNLFTADIMASVTCYGIGIYASWSPMKLFNKPYGPELKSWSIGLEFTAH